MDIEKYFGFVYRWIDSTNGKTYTGSHEGLVTDNYVGSGILFKKAYDKRPDKFSREILEFVIEDDKKKLLEVEQNYLDQVDWDNTYNLSTIAGGGNTRSGYTEKQLIEYYQKLSETTKGKNKGKIPWNKGKKGLQISWRKGLTKETSPKLKEIGHKVSKINKRKVTCPFCGKYGGITAMKRWHFENCREIK